MDNLKKNVIFEGVFSAEMLDSSGELMKIDGMDISSIDGKNGPQSHGFINVEHTNPADITKDEHKDSPLKGFETIIGKTISAKKIFSEDDCESDKELAAFKQLQKPLLWGKFEIFDGQDAPESARAAASLARMLSQDPNGPQLGVSVEGSTLKREGNELTHTVIRGLAATIKPCLKVAYPEIIEDNTESNRSPSSITKSIPRLQDGSEMLHKSVPMQYVSVQPQTQAQDPILSGIANALQDLKKARLNKTLTAGSGNAAPSSLTGGEALQKESQLGKIAKLMGKKPINKETLMRTLPGLTDKNAETVEKVLKSYLHKKNLKMTEKIYKSLKK